MRIWRLTIRQTLRSIFITGQHTFLKFKKKKKKKKKKRKKKEKQQKSLGQNEIYICVSGFMQTFLG